MDVAPASRRSTRPGSTHRTGDRPATPGARETRPALARPSTGVANPNRVRLAADGSPRTPALRRPAAAQ